MFHKEKRVIARKQHECNCCHSTIIPRTEYARLEFTDDGEFVTWKLCGRCEYARQQLMQVLHDGGFDMEYTLCDIDNFIIKKDNKVEFTDKDKGMKYMENAIAWNKNLSVSPYQKFYKTISEPELIDSGFYIAYSVDLIDNQGNEFDAPLFMLRKFFD